MSAAAVSAPAGARRVLVIDDEPAVLRVLGLLLERNGFFVASANNAREGLALLADKEFDVVLSDIIMPELSGLDFLKELRQHDVEVPVILMTAGATLDSALDAIEYGAQQYLLKPVEPEALIDSVGRAAAIGELARIKRTVAAAPADMPIPAVDRATPAPLTIPANLHAPLTILSDEETAFRDAVESFVNGEIRPRVGAMERAAKLDPDLIPKYFELGMMGIQVPEKYGGGGGSLMMVTIAVEEISKVDAAAAIVVDVQNTLVAYPILVYGTEEQRRQYLPRLCENTVGAYALSEAGSGSDAFGLGTRAEKKGDKWILTGRKLWITNGAEAGVFIVFANTDHSKGYKGITAFIVEKSFPGFSVGKKEDKMGIRASSTTELILDGVEVPACNVLGPVGNGYKIAMETLNEGRIGIGAQMIGNAQGALAAAVAYVKERKQFGKSLSEFQGVQFQLAQVATELEAARLMVYNATRLKEAGHDIAREAAMAKLYASQVCERVTSQALELFGGYGYTKEYPAEKFYRDAKIGKIYEGTSNMQLSTIAKALLK